MIADAVWWPLHRQVAAIRSGRLAAKDLAGAYLERIRQHDPLLATHVALNPAAMEEASAIDACVAAGEDPGPLAGACISVKDNYLTAGLATEGGAAPGLLSLPKEDSHVVERLRAAGAIVLGKTRMHELAWGNITPPTRNPWNTDCVPGGSSGGSAAAVAAGLCSAALGSDTGGSVRIPAGICGTVGIKPTFGLVGRSGIVPHSWSLDHAGPLTRTARDAALMLEVMAGPDADDPGSADRDRCAYAQSEAKSLDGHRVAIIRNHFSEQVATDVSASFDESLTWAQAQGAKLREFEVPDLEYGLGAIFAIELASASAQFDTLVQSGKSAELTEDVRDLIEMGRLVSAVDYLHAERVRSKLCAEFARIFETSDIVICPTSPITSWRAGEWEINIQGESESVLAASWRFTYPFNLTGLPAITVPAGWDANGLPMGLQFVGPPFSERRILNAALAFESQHDYVRARPPGFE